jgi:hypothetical protein
MYGGEEKWIQRFLRKPERKRLLGSPKWDNNIKMDLERNK